MKKVLGIFAVMALLVMSCGTPEATNNEAVADSTITVAVDTTLADTVPAVLPVK